MIIYFLFVIIFFPPVISFLLFSLIFYQEKEWNAFRKSSGIGIMFLISAWIIYTSHFDLFLYNIIHNPIRKGIDRSSLFRYGALKLDDFFYGEKPLPKPLPAILQEE